MRLPAALVPVVTVLAVPVAADRPFSVQVLVWGSLGIESRGFSVTSSPNGWLTAP
ncbi:MAG: hypothetical protein RLZZ255_1294 [Cyanobacteriota bacterium]|jgi:hypothetical protein